MTDQMFHVGKIVNTHGVHGEVKVASMTDFDERFTVGETLYIETNDGESLELVIANHRQHQQYDLLRFEGYNNINEMESFKGKMLKIKENQLAPLVEGEFYFHEIVECDVFTTSGKLIGEITHILKTGANDVWEVKSTAGKVVLIPFIKDVVKEVDVHAKKVIIEPMEGLLD